MILVPLPYKLYGFFCLCLNMEKWKTFCTNRKVNRGWRIYFDIYYEGSKAKRKKVAQQKLFKLFQCLGEAKSERKAIVLILLQCTSNYCYLFNIQFKLNQSKAIRNRLFGRKNVIFFVYTHFKYKFSHFVRFSDIQIISHMKGPKQKGRKLRNSLIYCQKLLRNYLNVTKSDEM